MGKLSFSDGLALFGISLGIVLLVLDKAGKMKGVILLVGLAISALLILPLALGNSWVTGSFGMQGLSRGMLIICFVGMVYSSLAIWVSIEDLDSAKLNPAFPSTTPLPEIESPIENLARLGWNIKRDAEDSMLFEIVNKPLPNMEESANYLRALNKPFQLHLQQVSSVAGFTFLSGINNCIRLEINASDIEDLSELRGLAGLRTLIISQTPFSVRHQLNISAIASLMNIETINLNGSRVNNLEPLRGLMKLVSLNIGGSLVRDLSPIKNLELLTSLDVRDSRVTDLSVLDGADALEELSVDEKQVPSLTRLSHLAKLYKLNIITHEPLDMMPVGTLSNLKSLFVWGPSVIDLSPLRKVSKLTNVQVSGSDLNQDGL